MVRDTAVVVLLRVFEKGEYIDTALDRSLRRRNLSERGRRFLTHLVYGVARHYLLCDHVLTPLVTRPLESVPRPILTILRMGIFQALFCHQVTTPSMVHTSVDLAKRHGHAGTAQLVNAVLRRAPRSLDDVSLPSSTDEPVAFISTRYSIPRWMTSMWIDELGKEAAEAFCKASAEPAPVTLRANQLRSSAEQLMAGLAKTGYRAEKRTAIPEEATVLEGIPPVRSKLFQGGHCFVQDPASMLPPHLLEPQPGEKVLDLCAAPGGKTTHMAELTGGEACIVALDRTTRKLATTAENIRRLDAPGIWLVQGDGKMAPFPEGTFDRVLVDAPCSGLGTLRRHPELKWRTRPEDINRLAVEQQALLRAAIRLCKNTGVIVYSVCTVSQSETEGVLHSILDSEPVRREDGPEWLDTWKNGIGTYQTNPHHDGLDGFFLTRLRKQS